jgi:HD-GYP domain-containing protein (c-di-GMP phosphodiesterase class II)
MSDNHCEELRFAGLLHDIGKLGIPEAVLFKAGKLTSEEYNTIKKHPAVTRQILGSIHFPRNLKNVTEIASTHHERVNGSGYPEGLSKEEIPVGGRMLALADVFDALTSKRQYRDREPIEKVWQTIENESDETFDKQIVSIFGNIALRRIVEIMEYDQRDRLDQDELESLGSLTFRQLLKLKMKGDDGLTSDQKKIIHLFDKYYLRRY